MINRRSDFHCLYRNPCNVPTAPNLLNIVCGAGILLAPLPLPTHHNDEETNASETIEYSGCVRRKLCGRIRMRICSFYLSSNLDRICQATYIVQLPFMAVLVTRYTASDELSATCRQVSSPHDCSLV